MTTSDNCYPTVDEGVILRSQYAHTGLGQRYEKSAAGITTRYVYDQDGHLLAEVNAAGAVLTEYVYLEGAPLAMIANNQLSLETTSAARTVGPAYHACSHLRITH